jgi:hypothetical protein
MVSPLSQPYFLLCLTTTTGCAGIIFNSMCNGGTIIMATSDDYTEKATKCEAIIITPTILATMDSPAQYPNLREIWMGGEAPSANLIKLWSSPACKIYNCYGPTECTTAISSIEMRPDTPIFLGGIIPGIEIVLLDENLEEAEAGEICIRGPCLATGYLNNEELTRQKFITWKGQRHYRSGDLAKKIPEGFAFIGRIDLQVKNRGFLINLETEVVPALLSFPGVRSAAAIMHDSRLIGFITPSEISPQSLRKELAKKCDAFVVPDVVLPLDRLPVTSNQKIDTAALKSIITEETTTHNWLSDHSSASELVKFGLSNALRIPISQINDDSSFWELGGNSLSAVRLASFLAFRGLRISVGDIFVLDKASSILQKVVSTEAAKQSVEFLISEHRGDAATANSLPISDIQYQFITETLRSPAKNNLIFSFTVDIASGKLSSSVLRKAWETLFERHSILRTTFDLDAKTQLIQPESNLDWTEIQVSDSEFDSTSEKTQKALWDEIYSPIELPWKPFNYLKVVEAPERSIKIFWVMHHSLFDGWSVTILLNELEVILNDGDLPAAPHFSDVVHFQEHLKAQIRSESDIFWKKSLASLHGLKPINVPKPLNTPSLETRQDWLSKSSVISISKSELDNFAYYQRVSSSSLFHATWSLVLSKYTGSQTIGYNSSFSGRSLPLPSIESIVGPLNQRCPTLTTVDKTATLEQYLRGIHREVYELRDFQWSSYGVTEKMLGHEAHESLLDSSITIFLDMSPDFGRWKVQDEQKPVRPLELRIEQDRETINAHLRYDFALFDGEAVRQILADVDTTLITILRLPPHASVASVIDSIAYH